MDNTARAAYLTLIEAAGDGNEFRVDQVLSEFEGEPGRIIGRGHDFEEKVSVIGSSADETLGGKVDLRILQMPAFTPEEILVRVRVSWQSNYGDHSSFVSCVLNLPAAERLDENGARDAETAGRMLQLLHLPRVQAVDADMWLRTILTMAHNYGVKWVQGFPRPAGDALHNLIAEYHRRAVTRLRADHPGMLGLLAPTYLDAGYLDPADLDGLCGWLQTARSENPAA